MNEKNMYTLADLPSLQGDGFDPIKSKVKEEEKDEYYTLLKDALADLKSAY